MSEAELVKSPDSSSQLRNNMDSSVLTFHDPIFTSGKTHMNGLLLPQFPSLLGDYHVQRAGPLKTPRVVSTLSTGLLLNDCPWSVPNEEHHLVDEKLIYGVDTRVVDYRSDISKRSSEKFPQHLDVIPCPSEAYLHSPPDVIPCPSEAYLHSPPKNKREIKNKISPGSRLNKFVRRLYDMLCGEKNSGIVQWRRGLLILLDTKAFAKNILPKYFNTRNFKTFRRQLNYYGFVHVRSYSNTGTKSTTALWVNQDLATGKISEMNSTEKDLDSVTSVLHLKRVEPCDSVKTSEGRRVRKELAMSAIEDDLGVSPQSLQLQQLCGLSGDHPQVASQQIDVPDVDQYNNLSHSTASVVPLSLLTETSSTANAKDQHPIKTLSLNNCCRLDSSQSENADTKPPTSSTSVANLLLLLSSG